MPQTVQETTIMPEQKVQRVIKSTKVIDPSGSSTSPRAYATKKTIFRTYQIIWYILSILEVFLLARFVLKAIGANSFSGFVQFVYAATEGFTIPFQGIVQNAGSGTVVFEWASLIAMLVYAGVAIGIVYLFQLIKPVNPTEVEEKVNNP